MGLEGSGHSNCGSSACTTSRAQLKEGSSSTQTTTATIRKGRKEEGAGHKATVEAERVRKTGVIATPSGAQLKTGNSYRKEASQ